MFFEMKEDIRDKLTEDDIIDVLMSLGSSYPQRRKDSLIFQTVCHHHPDDKMSYKLYYYFETGIFKCYTGGQDAYDIYGLIQDTMWYRGYKISLEESIGYVVNHTTVNLGFGIEKKRERDTQFTWDFIDEYKRAMEDGKEEIQVIKKIPSHTLNFYKDAFYKGWLKEGISVDSMKKFNIKYSITDNRVVIPHYDINNNLIGIRGRALRKSEINDGYKYMPMTIQKRIFSHPTSMNFYGIYRNKKVIRNLRQAVIFESEKSVLKAETIYPNNNFTLAMAGKKICSQQIKLLLHLNVDRVILALDKDYTDFYSDEGVECFENMLELANFLKPYFTVFIMVDEHELLRRKQSPIDGGKEVFEELYHKKIRI